MKRWWIILLVLVLLAGGGWWLLRDRLIRRWVESALTAQLGGTPQVESVQTRPGSSRVTLSGIQLAGAEDWPLDATVRIRTIDLRYRLASLLGSVVNLPTLLLDIEQVSVTIPPDGSLDLSALGRPRTSAADPAPDGTPASTEQPATAVDTDESATAPHPPAPQRPARKRRTRDFQVDELTFRLGHIEIIETAADGGDPHVRQYRLNYERQFTDITDMEGVLQTLGTDLAFALAPHLLRDAFTTPPRSRPETEPALPSTEELEALGRQLDAETKDVQRELRRLRREFMDR